MSDPVSRPPLAALVAGGLLAVAAFLGPAQAETPAAGDWRGEGRIATEAGAKPRTARCRAAVGTGAAPGQAAATLFTIDGRCAVAAGRSGFSLSVTLRDNGAVTAELSAPALSRPARFRGERHGNRISLAATALFDQGGRRHSSRLEIRFEGADRFSIAEWQRPESGGTDRLSLSLDFERRQ